MPQPCTGGKFNWFGCLLRGRSPVLPGSNVAKSAGGDRRGPSPCPLVANPITCGLALGFRLRWVRDNPLQAFAERGHVGFQQPAGFHQLHAAHAVAKFLPLRRNAIRQFVSRKIIRASARRDDDRQAARHRFQHGQAEAFAAIRMHEAVARRVEARHVFGADVIGEVENLRRIRFRLRRANLRAERLPRIDGLAAEILNHETQVVSRREVVHERFQQDVRSFSVNRAANEEKFELLLRREETRSGLRLEALRINSVRHDMDFAFVHSGFDVASANELARHPNLIDANQGLHPLDWHRTKLPRLYQHPCAALGARPIRWPRMAHGHLRVR